MTKAKRTKRRQTAYRVYEAPPALESKERRAALESLNELYDLIEDLEIHQDNLSNLITSAYEKTEYLKQTIDLLFPMNKPQSQALLN